jgi:hypothetical protein
MKMIFVVVAVAALVLPLMTRAGIARESARQAPAGWSAMPIDPITAIMDALQSHDIVALGEGTHNNEQSHRFRLSLIEDVRFSRVVNDVVVEWGNALYQDVMDRFVNGDNVSADTLRKVWQNTTQPHPVWDVSIYEEFFRAVRRINASVPAARRLRVLLGDPPIDWDTIRSRADLDHKIGFSDRAAFAADVVQHEVVARGRRGLVVYGDMHLQRRNVLTNFQMDTPAAHTLVSRLEMRGTRVFTIWSNTSIDLRNVDVAVPTWPIPSLAIVRGTSLGAEEFSVYLPTAGPRMTVRDGKPLPLPRSEWAPLRMEDQFNAILYLGSPSSITIAPLARELCADPGYLEMRVARMSLLPFPPGPNNPIDRLKQYCVSIAAR